MKTNRQLERIVRGFSNHRRIEMLKLLDKMPELSVFEISAALHTDFKNAAQHAQRLAIAGLVLKRNEGPAVRHALSPLGKQVLRFLKTLE